MNVTCTIITADYLHFALALNESLLRFRDVRLYVLVVDMDIDTSSIMRDFPNVKILYLSDIDTLPIAKKIIQKYKGHNEDALRWSLKSVLIHYLLSLHQKVLYLDCDLYFYNDYQFLFDELEENHVILTPHWRNATPHTPHNSFELIFTSGLFNAGFIGCNQSALEVMVWWANCCEYKCEINPSEGHYVDQTYLNLMPIYFEHVKILRHKGCNVSEWNFYECKRTMMPDNEIWINEKYPIIFIHFVSYLVEDIKSGKDSLLATHLDSWVNSLNSYKHLSQPYKILKEEKRAHTKPKRVSPLQSINQKIRIRTRIKRFLQG